jgi:Zn-dependent peptidase ImmA (M78 family)/transcriptional regulator with XRE-family HTH domain
VRHFGEHIRRLRAAYGFDLAKLTALSGIPVSRVAEIEAGAPLSTAELAQLADALAVDPAILHSGKIGDTQRTVARFRAPIGTSDIGGTDARLLARAAEAGEICNELRTLLGKKTSPIIESRKPVAVANYPEPWRQGYELGRAAREVLVSTHDGLDSVQQSLEELGVHVAFVRFEAKGIEAASLVEPGSSPVILLNKASSRVKYPLSRRAILAHELCHLLHDGGERDLAIISREEGLDTSGTERRANGFAPNFLAPNDWVSAQKASAAPGRTSAEGIVTELAQKWGLSLEGAAWHAKNIGLIGESEVELFRAASRPGFETQFEPDLPRTPPDLVGIEAAPTDLVNGYLSELAIIAAEEGVISKGRAAEILSLQ